MPHSRPIMFLTWHPSSVKKRHAPHREPLCLPRGYRESRPAVSSACAPYEWRKRRMRKGTCAACQQPAQRLAPATDDCVCLVCEACTNAFLEANQCGVCGTVFTDDEPLDDSDDQ